MEGARISWDELTCVGYEVTDKAIKNLCNDMNRYRRELQQKKDSAGKIPVVTRANLENWNVIKKTNDGYLASNAFVLMTSDYFPFSKTQCAVFKGTNRAVFLDKREYTGPIYNQIEEAVNFVLRNIRLGAKIDGLIRKEAYELPVEAIREMIINAHCHRNLREESCVQVAIYDDRLEVSSPGGLYNGLTFDEAMNGHSKLRNRTIANIFAQMGLIEAWGTGLQRIKSSAEDYNLPQPEFIEMPETFRVNLYRNSLSLEERNPVSADKEKQAKKTSEENKRRKQAKKASEENKRRKTEDNIKKICDYLMQYGESKTNDIAAYIDLSPSRTRAIISKMENVEVIGTNTNRKYKLKDN
jgi:predicted HTH transcriptional regulator